MTEGKVGHTIQQAEESKLLTTKKKTKKKVFFLFIKEMIYTLL
jgi:hypothetical protein